MEERDQKKYELATVQGANGTKYLLFVEGSGSIPKLAPKNSCVFGDGTTKGVIEAFKDVVMSSEWGQLETMRVTYKMLHYLGKRRIKINLFVFIQDYELFKKGRHDLCISFRAEGCSEEHMRNLVKKGLMSFEVNEEDIKV